MKFTRTRQMDTLRRDIARLGGETRTLLRSRTVQSLLVATAVVQAAAVVTGEPEDARKQPRAPEQTALSQPLAPVSAQYIRRAVVAEPAAAEKDSAETKADAEATELAAEYREKGYRVTDTLAEQIVEAASEHGIAPDVAFGLVATESGFKRTARSSVGAVGLAQLMPATARWLEPGTTRRDLEDPETNLRLGFRYLRDMIEKYDGDTELALTAYNRGPGTVDRVLRRGGDPDNGYAGKVLGTE
jgi:soluble lytic murein transglycosylase-like protein